MLLSLAASVLLGPGPRRLSAKVLLGLRSARQLGD